MKPFAAIPEFKRRSETLSSLVDPYWWTRGRQNKGDVVLPLKLDVPGEASNSVVATATFEKAEMASGGTAFSRSVRATQPRSQFPVDCALA